MELCSNHILKAAMALPGLGGQDDVSFDDAHTASDIQTILHRVLSVLDD